MIFNRKQSVFPALRVLRAAGRAESWIYVKLNRLPRLCCLLLVWQSVYRVKQTEATSRNISCFSEQGHGQKLKQSAGNVWKTIGSNNTVQLPARIMKGWDTKDLFGKNRCQGHIHFYRPRKSQGWATGSDAGEKTGQESIQKALPAGICETDAKQTESKAASW